MNIYEKIVSVVVLEIQKNPKMTDKQIKGYVEYLGVFVPKMRDHIIKEAKVIVSKNKKVCTPN